MNKKKGEDIMLINNDDKEERKERERENKRLISKGTDIYNQRKSSHSWFVR